MQPLQADQDALGVVHVQPHALALRLGQRPVLVPNVIRYPSAADIVEQTRQRYLTAYERLTGSSLD